LDLGVVDIWEIVFFFRFGFDFFLNRVVSLGDNDLSMELGFLN
jgi:hypothetical protein